MPAPPGSISRFFHSGMRIRSGSKKQRRKNRFIHRLHAPTRSDHLIDLVNEQYLHFRVKSSLYEIIILIHLNDSVKINSFPLVQNKITVCLKINQPFCQTYYTHSHLHQFYGISNFYSPHSNRQNPVSTVTDLPVAFKSLLPKKIRTVLPYFGTNNF